MTFSFLPWARRSAPALLLPRPESRGHVIESDFYAGRCRFVLACSCGSEFETRYIDEALEWRELHELLAPMADQLPQ